MNRVGLCRDSRPLKTLKMNLPKIKFTYCRHWPERIWTFRPVAGDFQATGVNVAGLNVTGLNVRDPTKLCFNRFITFSNWEKLLGKILSQTNIRKHAKSVRK